MWLLLAIALPLTRALVHRLALAAGRRDPSTRTAKALHQADSTVTAVSRRTALWGAKTLPWLYLQRCGPALSACGPVLILLAYL